MTSKGLLRNPGNHVFGGKIKIIAFLTGFEKSAIKPREAQHNRYFTLFFFCIHDFVLKILQMPKLEPKSNVFMLPSAFDQFFFFRTQRYSQDFYFLPLYEYCKLQTAFRCSDQWSQQHTQKHRHQNLITSTAQGWTSLKTLRWPSKALLHQGSSLS